MIKPNSIKHGIDNLFSQEGYLALKDLSHIPEVKETNVVFGFNHVICKIETSNDKTLENH